MQGRGSVKNDRWQHLVAHTYSQSEKQHHVGAAFCFICLNYALKISSIFSRIVRSRVRSPPFTSADAQPE